MSMGSLLAGMAMSNARLGAVHGMAHPLRAHYHIPHGTVCAILLAPTMRHNLPYAYFKYAEVASLLGVAELADDAHGNAQRAIDHIAEMLAEAGLPAHLSPMVCASSTSMTSPLRRCFPARPRTIRVKCSTRISARCCWQPCKGE